MLNNGSEGRSCRRLLIIGAGPTALGALHRFCQLRGQQLVGNDVDVILLEQENEVGGLARSVTDEHGFTWDLGVHVMGISKYPDFVNALAECVPKWRIVPRCAMADMSHVMVADGDGHSAPLGCCYVPYPVQNSIPYFPEPLKEQCLAELGGAQFGGCCLGEATANNIAPGHGHDFDSFSLALFGPTLQRIFIKPYNEKVWTVRLSEMGTSWLQGRVPLIDFAQLSRRCALPRAQLLAEDGQRPTAFRYPADCRGVGEMWRRFGDRFPAENFRLGHRVVSIDAKAKLVKTVKANESVGQQEEEEVVFFNYDCLISTMPLTELGKLSGLAPKLALKYSTVILVGIGLHGGQSEFGRQLSWAYYPRQEIIFYRSTVLANFSPEMVPQGGPSSSSSPSSPSDNPFWSVLCEIGQSSEAEIPSGPAQKEAIVERVIQDLIRVGLVPSRSNVCASWLKCLPFGYPIPTRDRDQLLAQCQAAMEEHQIYSRGRFGGWRYEISNQDHSFQCGIELIDRLFLGIPESVHSSS